jgi:hypothetical protein
MTTRLLMTISRDRASLAQRCLRPQSRNQTKQTSPQAAGPLRESALLRQFFSQAIAPRTVLAQLDDHDAKGRKKWQLLIP